MNTIHTENEKLDKRLKKGSRQIFLWTFAWLVTTALIAFGPKLLWNFHLITTLIVIAFNIGIGIKVLIVHKRHLDDMDEMQRKIHFNAMAVSLGVTILFGTLYGLLEPAGILSSTPNPSNILFVLGISYMVTVLINFRKYS